MNNETNNLHTKLAHCVVALAAIRVKVEGAGKLGQDFEAARDVLHEAFDVFGEIRATEGADETVCVCERDGASLHATQRGLYHAVSGEPDVLVEQEHELTGNIGSIVVNGFEWRWQEMADGVIVRAARMLDGD